MGSRRMGHLGGSSGVDLRFLAGGRDILGCLRTLAVMGEDDEVGCGSGCCSEERRVDDSVCGRAAVRCDLSWGMVVRGSLWDVARRGHTEWLS